MARKGRELERLVALLEEILGPVGAQIKSPDFLPDSITGESREVDVSIRFTDETGPKLVVGECRDRDQTSDVTWIEQAVTKLRDLKVDLGFLVSSSGFSQAAKTKAESYGINLRLLSTLTPQEVQSWFRAPGVVVVEKIHALVGAKIMLLGGDTDEFDEQVKKLLSEMGFDAPILERTDLPPVSLSGLWYEVRKRTGDEMWKSVPNDGTPKLIQHVTSFEEPEKCFRVRTAAGSVPITSITLEVELRVKQTMAPVSRVSKYESAGTELARNVEIDLPIDQNKLTLSLHKLPSGKTEVRVRFPEREYPQNRASKK